MKFEIYFSTKVFENEKLRIHLVVLSVLTKRKEVNEVSKKSIKIKELGKSLKQTKCNVLELWRKMSLSDNCIRPKRKHDHKPELELWRKMSLLDNCIRPRRKHDHTPEDDDDSINSAEDIRDALR